MKKITASSIGLVLLCLVAPTWLSAAATSGGWGGGVPGNIVITINVASTGATDTYDLPDYENRYAGRVLYRLWVYSPDNDAVTVSVATDPDDDNSYSNVLASGSTTGATSGESINTSNAPLVGPARVSVSGLTNGQSAFVYIVAY